MVDTTPHGTGSKTSVLNTEYDPDEDGKIEEIDLQSFLLDGETLHMGEWRVTPDTAGDTLTVTHNPTGNSFTLMGNGQMSVPTAPDAANEVARKAEVDAKVSSADTGEIYTQSGEPANPSVNDLWVDTDG